MSSSIQSSKFATKLRICLMLNDFLTYIKVQKLFQPTDKVLLAVSGGKDSMALTNLFLEANYSFGIAHCNFQLRGNDSDLDEAFVKNHAEKHHIPFFSTKFQTKEFAKKHNLSTQMAARQLRYEWFEKIRIENEFDYLATAHHLNDNIETILLNLTKGTGISGIRGILPKTDKIIRPFLFASREMIDAYVSEKNLAWREDISNESDDYQRNLLRHHVVPILKQINPNLENTFERNIERFQALEADFQKNFQYFKTTVLRKENETIFLKIKNIKYWQSPSYYLVEILKEYGFNYFQSKEIFKSLDAISGKTFHSETHELIKDREELIIQPKNNQVFEELLIDKNTAEIEYNGLKISIEKIDIDPQTFQRENGFEYLDASKITFPLIIRPWQEGDWFIPLGMTGKKKISDFLIDKKTPLHLKKVTFLLLSDGQVLWLIGNRIDNRFKITSATQQVLRLRIR